MARMPVLKHYIFLYLLTVEVMRESNLSFVLRKHLNR